ncbi:MAG: rhomboid family intramembrane serine protease [Bdellovibrionaceae bacterium]|nr:rhomboid family intramembrane serine protease [Bdellovibrio sp.]
MEFNTVQPQLIEEKRLIGTMITGKPSAYAFAIATLTIIAMVLMTVFYWIAPVAWADFLPAVNSQVYQHSQTWRIFTATFIHADLEHLLSNMYMLWIFSYFVCGYFGFSMFPILSFFLAGLVNAIAVKTYAPDIELLGASGLVYLLGGLWLTLYFLIQRQYSIMNRLIRVTGIAAVIFIPSTFVPTTSYRTHAIGFAFGIGMALFYFFKNKNMIRAYEVYKINYV